MNILIACEYSGRVREAFRARGHNVLSCDLEPSDLDGPHYRGDVRHVLNLVPWDMLIGFPPCTWLSLATTWRWHRPESADHMRAAVEFFLLLWRQPIPRIALENPPGWINSHVMRASQTVQPWWFGEDYTKRTSLWLKNLPPLMATCPTIPQRHTYIVNMAPGPQRAKLRSLTPPGLARAMAEQWG